MLLQKHDAMSHAIKAKRGKHLEITIKVEPKGEEDAESPEDKAAEMESPLGDDPAVVDPAADPSKVAAASAPEEELPFLRGYNDSDKESLMKRKPHSIKERAIQSHIKGKHKGA